MAAESSSHVLIETPSSAANCSICRSILVGIRNVNRHVPGLATRFRLVVGINFFLCDTVRCAFIDQVVERNQVVVFGALLLN